METQPIYATRKTTSFQTFRTVTSRLGYGLALIALGVCTYIGAYHALRWLLSFLPPFTFATGLGTLCAVMAVACGLLAWRSFYNWKNSRLWIFSAVFFGVTCFQAFFVGGV